MHTALWRCRGVPWGTASGRAVGKADCKAISWLSRQEPSCKNPLKSIDAYNDCKDTKGWLS